MTQNRVIVFDLDDTLYLERSFVASGFRATGAWFERETGICGLEKRCAELHRDGERGRIFDRALEALGVGPSEEMVVRLVEVYRGHEPDIDLASDAARYLSRRRQGIAYALITDGHLETQMAKAQVLQLPKILDHLICTGTWGRDFWKPHPRAFEAVEAWSDRAAGDLVYVADNPVKDFVTPRARGWWTVQVARPERVHHTRAPDPAHEAHRMITSLDELDDCLNELDRGWSVLRTG